MLRFFVNRVENALMVRPAERRFKGIFAGYKHWGDGCESIPVILNFRCKECKPKPGWGTLPIDRACPTHADFMTLIAMRGMKERVNEWQFRSTLDKTMDKKMAYYRGKLNKKKKDINLKAQRELVAAQNEYYAKYQEKLAEIPEFTILDFEATRK